MYEHINSKLSPLASIRAEDMARLGLDMENAEVLYSGPGEYAKCVTICAPTNLSDEEIQRRKNETMRIVEMMHRHNLERGAYDFQKENAENTEKSGVGA